MLLSRKHKRLLKKINRKTIVRTDKHNIADVKYLRDQDLIQTTICDKKDDYYCQPIITEKGKAVLDNLKETKKKESKSNLALLFSGFALLLSFLTAFTPFADWCRALIEKLFS